MKVNNNRIAMWVLLLLMSLILTAGSILGFSLKALPVGISFGIGATLMALATRDYYVRHKAEKGYRLVSGHEGE